MVRIVLAALFAVLGLSAAPAHAVTQPTEPTEPPQSAAQTIVSFTFDDGFSSQLQAATVLARLDMPATFYINSGALGWDGYMTSGQVRQLYEQGNEIAGHTLSHDHLTELPADVMRREICDDRSALLDMGLPVTSFAYPYSDYNNAVVDVVEACGYTGARISSGLYNDVDDCADCPTANQLPVTDERWTVRTNETVRQGPDTVATLKANVVRAERSGGWVPIVFHRICDGCSEESITLAQFTEFATWMAQRPDSTSVQTVNQVMTGPCYPISEDFMAHVDGGTCATQAPAAGADGEGLPHGRGSLNDAVAFSIAGVGVGQVEVIAITITIALGLIGAYRFKTRRQRLRKSRS